MRKEYLSEQLRPPSTEGAAAAQPANPMEALQGGMKSQIINMVTQMGMMMWVQSYFQGFLLVKLPFGLTERFRQLTQAGIGAGSALDISYVSSMSWYMICSAGIPRLLMLVQQSGGEWLSCRRARVCWYALHLQPTSCSAPCRPTPTAHAGDPAFDESRMMQMQMGMMGGQPQGQPWNAKQAFAAVRAWGGVG